MGRCKLKILLPCMLSLFNGNDIHFNQSACIQRQSIICLDNMKISGTVREVDKITFLEKKYMINKRIYIYGYFGKFLIEIKQATIICSPQTW